MPTFQPPTVPVFVPSSYAIVGSNNNAVINPFLSPFPPVQRPIPVPVPVPVPIPVPVPVQFQVKIPVPVPVPVPVFLPGLGQKP